MTNIKHILLLALSLLLLSCIKDKGNYDYIDFPKVTITDIDSVYSVKIGDTLHISPSVIEIDTSQYTYQWFGFIYNVNNNKDTITISKDKTLNYVVKLSEAEYRFSYRLFNKKTQLMSSKNFTVNVSSDLKRGIILMSEANGGARLDMISVFDNSYAYKNDVLNLINSTVPVKGIPLQVCGFSDRLSPPVGTAGYAFYIITSETANRVLSSDFSYKEEYALKYQLIGMPANFRAEKIFTIENTEYNYLYSNNNFYFGSNSATGTLQWIADQPLNRVENSFQSFKASPHIAMYRSAIAAPSSGAVAVIYDVDATSFLYHNNASRTVKHFKAEDSKLFPYQNTKMTLVYMSSIDVLKKTVFYAILEDPATKKRFLAAAQLDGLQTAYQEIVATNFQGSKMIAFPKAGNYMYYVASNNKEVYCYTFATQTTKLVYTAVSGYEINHFRFMERTTSLAISESSLFICSFDPSKPSDSNGRLDIMQIGNLGNLDVTDVNGKKLQWSNIPKIVSFTYKVK